MPVPLLIGTSGWQYRHWRGRLYPDGLPQRGWLQHYAARFATVEVNNAFYRLPEGSTFAAWGARTPDDFVVAVKASRYLTHVKRLRDPVEPLSRMLARHGAAFCLSDTPRRRAPRWRTADWGYVRFHEGRASPHPCYGRRALDTWAERLAGLWQPGEDVFAYFNNDPGGCAVRDARWFAAAARHAGLQPTRVPGPRETPIGTD